MKKLFCRDTVIAEHAKTALSFRDRLLGLSWRRLWPSSEEGHIDAYIFPGCSAIHTFFMFMPIDVIFLDSSNRIVRIVHSMRPWRSAWGGRNAVCTLELPAGVCAAGKIIKGEFIYAAGQQDSTLPPIA